MSKLFIIFFGLILIVSLSVYADNGSNFDTVFKNMALKLAKVEKRLSNKTVAVYGFEVIGRPKDSYSDYATEKFTHEVVNEGSLLVIERSRIDEVLQEQSFSLSGVVDAGTAAKIGKILSVDAVVTGTILVTEARTEFIVRAIQSETGIILASVAEYISLKTDETVKIGDPKPTAAKSEGPQLWLDKEIYNPSDSIVLNYSGLPGNKQDWFSLVSAAKPDTTYGQWFYTRGKKSGAYSFRRVPSGEYEIRLYLNWPAGGYKVKKRLKFKVE